MVVGVLAAASHDFARAWSKLLVVHVLYRIAAFALLAPLVGGALRLFVAISGEAVVADQDIVYFVLSPVGLVALVVVTGAGVAMVAVEQAVLMTFALGTARGEGVNVLAAVKLAARRSPSILQLAVRLVVRVLLLGAPFLAVAAFIYSQLLTEHDINFYLTQRPPVFWVAVALIGIVVAGCAAVVCPRLVSWLYALPIHLFEEMRPAAAIAASEGRARGRRSSLALALLAWAGASALVSIVGFGAAGAVGRSLVTRMQESMVGIRKIRELRPDWTVGLLAATAIGDPTRVDAEFLAVHTGLAGQRFIHRTRAAGKDIYVWTVNDPVHMSRMVSRGVDALITDEPALARRVLSERANLSSAERLFLEAAFYLGAVPSEPPATEDFQ